MPKNFVRKTFDRWLANRYTRFHYPPRLVLQRKEYFELQFSGITPGIQCSVSKRGVAGKRHDLSHGRGITSLGHVREIQSTRSKREGATTMPIATAIERGSFVYVYDEKGRQILTITAGISPQMA